MNYFRQLYWLNHVVCEEGAAENQPPLGHFLKNPLNEGQVRQQLLTVDHLVCVHLGEKSEHRNYHFLERGIFRRIVLFGDNLEDIVKLAMEGFPKVLVQKNQLTLDLILHFFTQTNALVVSSLGGPISAEQGLQVHENLPLQTRVRDSAENFNQGEGKVDVQFAVGEIAICLGYQIMILGTAADYFEGFDDVGGIQLARGLRPVVVYFLSSGLHSG